MMSSRLSFIDALRGIALIAMVIFHFTWDLEFFGWAYSGHTSAFGWVLFAHSIAASFLFLAGVSLVLAHGEGIQTKKFIKRFIQIALAAALISIATYIAFSFPEIQDAYNNQVQRAAKLLSNNKPSLLDYIMSPFFMLWPDPQRGFIFFGILHAIALFSLIGLAFVRLHWLISFGAAVVVLALNYSYTNAVFHEPFLWWVGLAPITPQSNDYVPLFPWIAPFLFGMAGALFLNKKQAWSSIKTLSLPAFLQTPLTSLGRHSLVFYLVHQPILFALIWSFTTLIGPADQTLHFIHNCTQRCSIANEKPFCKSYCTCTAEQLTSANLIDDLHKGTLNLGLNKKAQEIVHMCNITAAKKFLPPEEKSENANQ